MKLNRNPVLALVATAALMLAGCGAAPNVAGSNVALANAAVRDVDSMESLFHNPTEKEFSMWTVKVVELLPDDNQGLKHQEFIVTSEKNDKKIRIAHNTGLAAYVPVKVGDTVTIKGIFIKTGKSLDVLHWTHYNPQGGAGGYIELNGKKYERADGQTEKKTDKKTSKK